MISSHDNALTPITHKFEFVANCLCLDFCNTTNLAMPVPNERLKTFSDLVLWGQMAEVLDADEAASLDEWAIHHSKTAQSALHRARQLRAAMHQLFVDVWHKVPPQSADLDIINKTLVTALSSQRVSFDGSNFRIVWPQFVGPDRILWQVAVSAANLLTSENLKFVRQCSGSGCSWLFLDSTRNHSRRWCTMEICGNRAKARHFYQRSRAD